MKRYVAPIIVALIGTAALGATLEVLVGTAPTRIPRTATTTAVLLQNKGGASICCAQGADAGFPNCVDVPAGATLSLDIPSNQPITCISTVAQTADAGTRVLEVY